MSNYTEQQMNYAYEKIDALLEIVKELENIVPGRKFTLDGHLIGSIGEIVAAYHYGIILYTPSEKAHDGLLPDGREVQVKITQGNAIVCNYEPECLIVLHLDKATGKITEVYSGDGKNILSNTTSGRISLTQLLKLDTLLSVEQRIPTIYPIEKYKLSENKQNKNTTKVEANNGETVVKGYINKNSQMNCGCTGEDGNLTGQKYYWMKCLKCGYEYKANGCDIWLRKCPACMK